MSFTVIITDCESCPYSDLITDRCVMREPDEYNLITLGRIPDWCPMDNKDSKKAPYITDKDIKDLDNTLGQGGPFRWG